MAAHETDVRKYIQGRVTVLEDGCWLWKLTPDTHGYGVAARRTGKGSYTRLRAHRLSYETYVGAIPDGLDLDHLCRNRACCNPDHLEPVTRRENIRRGNGYIAAKIAATHCIAGHSLSGENLYVTPRGQRRCRDCQNRRKRKYYYRGKEKTT
jgi:hypothetical protein